MHPFGVDIKVTGIEWVIGLTATFGVRYHAFTGDRHWMKDYRRARPQSMMGGILNGKSHLTTSRRLAAEEFFLGSGPGGADDL